MAISAAAAAAAAAEAIAAATSLPGPRACLGRLHASSNSSSPSLGHHPRLVGLRASASGRRVAVACKAKEDAAGLDDVPDVAESTWDQLILGCEMPVLVEFWAPWCGPCRLMHPIIAKLAKTYNSKLKCFKLNTDNNQDVATKYGVRSIPTIMIFKNGEKKDTIIGAVPDATLVTTVERFL